MRIVAILAMVGFQMVLAGCLASINLEVWEARTEAREAILAAAFDGAR